MGRTLSTSFLHHLLLPPNSLLLSKWCSLMCSVGQNTEDSLIFPGVPQPFLFDGSSNFPTNVGIIFSDVMLLSEHNIGYQDTRTPAGF